MRANSTSQMLDKLSQLIDVNKLDLPTAINNTLQNFGAKLNESLTQSNDEKSIQLREENERMKEEIKMAEEESRRTKIDMRLAEEESRQVKAEMRKVEEDTRMIKERNRELERRHSEVEGIRNETERILEELQRDNQQHEETNRNMKEEKKQLVDKIASMEEENKEVRKINEIITQENRDKEQEIKIIQEEKNNIEQKNRLMEEEHQKCKKNVTDLSKRPTVPQDCAELYCSGVRQSGVYFINPGRSTQVAAWCDMTTDGGGWTVFLKRDHTGTHENFSRGWQDYTVGFGDPNQEYWLGNDALHHLTTPTPQVLRIDAHNFQSVHRWAQWSVFSVGDEDSEYQLQVEGYQQDNSTMGDFLVANHNLNGYKFSTKDRDNDGTPNRVCVESFSVGGGWWYNNCAYITPTGLHQGSGKHMLAFWTPNNKNWSTVKILQIKIRPRSYPVC
ncbi:fibrinogen-like protein A [Homarus americanus]|uniref:fibrinogen-like protein A n=1 Tax=Homarus americanus TaxID=6706 RepID=UPI001C4716C5|nr:fibrinogen-like protein A [Homarus americanus]